MKEYSVIIEPIAEKDLINIFSYISCTLTEPQAANRIYLSIKEKILSLRYQPCRYAVIDEEPYSAIGVRRVQAENYTAFYYIREKEKSVHVFRVLYNRREWRHLI